MNITSHLESIGNLIVNKLKGSERSRLKQKLLKSYLSNTSTINNLPICSSRRSLQQMLTDLFTLDCHSQRQYRTVGIGDNNVNNPSVSKTHNNELDTKIEEIDKINKLTTDQIPLSTVTKRKRKPYNNFLNASQIIDNEISMISPIRTICTRSSKLNSLNNNQESCNYN